MGIQTQQRIAQALQQVDVLIESVRAISSSLTEAENRIRDLTQRLEKLEHGPRQRQTARRD